MEKGHCIVEVACSIFGVLGNYDCWLECLTVYDCYFLIAEFKRNKEDWRNDISHF